MTDKFEKLLKKLLAKRGIFSDTDIEVFLNPEYTDNHDPYLMKDMEKAVERVYKAVKGNEKVVIFSDYDADGIPGAVVLHDLFKKIKFTNFTNYIPHRVNEGFGLNTEAIDKFAGDKVNLIITIDCGIADIKEAELVSRHSIDLIITDHHLPGQKIPNALAILDPKQSDCKYPFKELCGAGVIFKFVQAFIKKYGAEFDIKDGFEKWLLDMVGIATVSDMVPLVGENRLFAYYGLKVLRKTRRPGLQKLFSILKIDYKNITEDDIGFMIAPRINAASRMGEPEDAFILLSTDDMADAGKMAVHLDRINNERKGVVASMVKEIKKHWKEKDPEKKLKVLVAGNPDWKPSLLGLVANSLLDDHDGPVFLWGRDTGSTLKGSCRSDGCVNLVEMMQEAKDVFDEFGGHFMSGGFSISLDKVDALSDALERAYLNKKTEKKNVADEFDEEVSLDDIGLELYNNISLLSPFGMNNEKPNFFIKNANVLQVKIFGKEKNHLEIVLGDKGVKNISAISFFSKADSWGREIKSGDKISLVVNIEKSLFRNMPEIRLRIVDII